LSEFPEVDSLVVCRVKKVLDFGAFVELEEHLGKEGFIHISEISTGWVKRMSDFLKEGQRIVCKVIDVDPSRNRIDLSLKSVTDHQRREKIDEWKNEQRAQNLLAILAHRLGWSVEDCYEKFGKKLIKNFGSLYSAFEEASADESAFSKYKGAWVKPLIDVAKENIEVPSVKIKGTLSMTSTAPDGIKKIRSLLQTIEDGGVTVRYLGAPNYLIEVESTDYKTAEDVLKKNVKPVVDGAKKAGVEASFKKAKGQ
jgi:translation initiation factor 2 subunit 1